MTEILTPFLGAFILAYALQPLNRRLVAWHVPKSLATLLSLLLGALLALMVVLLLLNLIQNELPLIKSQFPSWLQSFQAWIAPKLANLGIELDWEELRKKLTAAASSQLSANANSILSSGFDTILSSSGSVVKTLANAILTIFIAFYLILDWENFFQKIQNLIPPKYRETTTRLALETNSLLSQYLRGQILLILTLALFYSLGMSILGIHGAIALGVFTGLVVIIPYLGVLLGFSLSIMAAFLQFGYGPAAFSVIALFGLGHLLESFFLTPRLVGERIGLHPVAVLFALLLFGEIFGFFGILLALPMAAVSLVLLRFLKEQYTNSHWFE